MKIIEKKIRKAVQEAYPANLLSKIKAEAGVQTPSVQTAKKSLRSRFTNASPVVKVIGVILAVIAAAGVITGGYFGIRAIVRHFTPEITAPALCPDCSEPEDGCVCSEPPALCPDCGYEECVCRIHRPDPYNPEYTYIYVTYRIERQNIGRFISFGAVDSPKLINYQIIWSYIWEDLHSQGLARDGIRISLFVDTAELAPFDQHGTILDLDMIDGFSTLFVRIV